VYIPKFLIEAKQVLKKQTILEKNRAIEKAQKKSNADEIDEVAVTVDMGSSRNTRDYGNETLSLYATLLMPLYDKNPAVAQLLSQLLLSNDKRLKYNTALLFIRNGKSVADSILNYFAADNNYRYELYTDLKDLNKQNLFPAKYNNQADLALSKLYNEANYNKPDTIAFLAKRSLTWANKEGQIYFFNYKRKKDDGWKIASVGLIQKDNTAFEFKKEKKHSDNYDLDFTRLSETKLKEDEPLEEQVNKRLKELVYSKRPSAKEFYKNEDDSDFSYSRFMK
jgi:hypothetical protein